MRAALPEQYSRAPSRALFFQKGQFQCDKRGAVYWVSKYSFRCGIFDELRDYRTTGAIFWTERGCQGAFGVPGVAHVLLYAADVCTLPPRARSLFAPFSLMT
jgi:hypothetical protein